MQTSLVIGVIAVVIGTLVALPPVYAGGTVTGTVVYTGKGEERKSPFLFLMGSNLCRKIGTDSHKPHLVKGDYRIIRTIEIGKGGALKATVAPLPMVFFVNVPSVGRIIFSIFKRFNLEWRQRTLRQFTQVA